MKIRIIKKLTDNVFDVRVYTEDWSANDRELMIKYGEPEINIGGVVSYHSDATDEQVSLQFDDAYERIMTESPFTRKFDARDYNNSVEEAKAAAIAWSSSLENIIVAHVRNLREKDEFFTTEEITEY